MDSLASVLVVFGVLGYFILRHCCHRTSFRWDALEWQQNVFESTGFGLLLFGLARAAAPMAKALIYACSGPWSYAIADATVSPYAHLLASASSAGSIFHDYLATAVPFSFSGTLILGTAIGVGAAGIANLRWSRDRSLDLVVQHHGGKLRILLHRAQRSEQQVMLTLTNRKMYVGSVFIAPPLRKPSHVVIFPTASGYRDEATLEVRWVTDYADAYQTAQDSARSPRIPPDHFQLVIPLDAILSATYFDRVIWDQHFDPQRERNDLRKTPQRASEPSH